MTTHHEQLREILRPFDMFEYELVKQGMSFKKAHAAKVEALKNQPELLQKALKLKQQVKA